MVRRLAVTTHTALAPLGAVAEMRAVPLPTALNKSIGAETVATCGLSLAHEQRRVCTPAGATVAFELLRRSHADACNGSGQLDNGCCVFSDADREGSITGIRHRGRQSAAFAVVPALTMQEPSACGSSFASLG